MSIGINDRFTFGKYKGRTFAEVMTNDPDGPHWCCWLREEKKKQGQPRAFDTEANAVIDEAIRNSKSLRNRYKVWEVKEADLQEIMAANAKAQQERENAEKERELAYANEWGAW